MLIKISYPNIVTVMISELLITVINYYFTNY